MMARTEARVAEASRLMLAFAERTGLGEGSVNQRYLWTDAFAVCNFVGLARATGQERYLSLAYRLIHRVHHTLGRHRADDARAGWLSGLRELEGERHPTRGGLRIGKTRPERRPAESFDERLEWERDGQYFHYLTKWLHALDQVARHARVPRFNEWARELAEVACRKFAARGTNGETRGLFWKMSVDLSRPAVPAMGQHDPLDGFVTCVELRATAENAGTLAGAPALDAETQTLARMLEKGRWATPDPLGIGGLLFDAYRLEQLAPSGASEHAALMQRVLAAATDGLALREAHAHLRLPAAQRLPFRELGLAIGLAATRLMSSKDVPLVDAARKYLALREEIEAFWLEPKAREGHTWTDHRDINEVMLATALLPEGFLVLDAGVRRGTIAD
jgi:hypothetical protein